MNTSDLILSVLGEAANAGVSLSKTKLLKLLYLIDIEAYRTRRQTATQWAWKFLHFGPWASEYDKTLDALSGGQHIEVTVLPGDRDRDTQLIRAVHRDVDVSALNDSVIRVATRRVLNRWLSIDLPLLLDHVYFDTEPMQHAERGSFLQFDSVQPQVEEPYRKQTSTAAPKKFEELRRKLGLSGEHRHEPARRVAGADFTPPKYDDAALELMRTLEDD